MEFTARRKHRVNVSLAFSLDGHSLALVGIGGGTMGINSGSARGRIEEVVEARGEAGKVVRQHTSSRLIQKYERRVASTCSLSALAFVL